jgi:hypothetical protein
MWDVRIYDRTLSDSEAKALTGLCAEDPVGANKYAGRPLYSCGPFHCIFWQQGAKFPRVAYVRQRILREISTEWGLLNSAIHPHENYCGFVAGGETGFDIVIGLNSGDEAYIRDWEEFPPPRTDDTAEGFRHEFGHWDHARALKSGQRSLPRWIEEGYASMAAQMINRPPNELIGSYTFVPFQSLFSDGTNESAIEAYVGRESGGHMYGSFIFYTYLADLLGYSAYIGNLYNGWNGAQNPLEYIKAEMATRGFDLAETFANFAARIITFDIPYGEEYQKMTDLALAWLKSMNPNLSRFDFSISRQHSGTGTGQAFMNIPAGENPGAYAYNAYKVTPTLQARYRIEIKPVQSSIGVATKARIVIFDPKTKTREYTAFDVLNSGVTVREVSTGAGKDLFLIVVPVPYPIPNDSDRTRYSYSYRIAPL